MKTMAEEGGEKGGREGNYKDLPISENWPPWGLLISDYLKIELGKKKRPLTLPPASPLLSLPSQSSSASLPPSPPSVSLLLPPSSPPLESPLSPLSSPVPPPPPCSNILMAIVMGSSDQLEAATARPSNKRGRGGGSSCEDGKGSRGEVKEGRPEVMIHYHRERRKTRRNMFDNLNALLPQDFTHDRYSDMRLDIDNMSYEELLALEERIGDVKIGLTVESVMTLLKQRKYMSTEIKTPSNQEPCCVCQEEYGDGDDLGTLDCGHDFHTDCIKQWLMQKNLCPKCKKTALSTLWAGFI